MPHLLVDISCHGFGHLSQTAPVLAQLRTQLGSAGAELRLTIRSGLPRARLARRIAEPFDHIAQASDFGFVMHNAVDIDFAASAQRYRAFHADWPAQIRAYAALLRELQVDAVVANAAYLPLAAAQSAGLPALGFCSLNWADLFQHYFGREPWAPPICQQMQAAYAAAREFLILTPGMAMPNFSHARPVGPVAEVRHRSPAQRARLAAKLGIGTDEIWVLLAMGGVEFRLPVESWPLLPGVRWLCPASWGVRRTASADFGDDDFADLLANTDVVLTKPGYGTFVEAACHGTAVLYVPREDWPEEAPLVRWLLANGRAQAIGREALWRGELAPALATLLSQPLLAPPQPTGGAEVAEALRRLCDRL